MRIVIGWVIVVVLVCVLAYIIVGNITRETALRKAIRRSKKWEREQNDAASHPPNPEEVDKIIRTFGYELYDGRGNPLDLDEYDSDSVSYVWLILKDVDWFCSNPTDVIFGEECKVLEEYLRNRYLISDESIKKAVSMFSRVRCMPNL